VATCVELGATMSHNAEAFVQALKDIGAFASAVLKSR
jgi:hypothetical protein